MTGHASLSTPPDNVQHVIATYPEAAKQLWQSLRAIIFECAENLPEVTNLTETLKWGEPSYLNKAGTTLRLAWSDKRPDALGLFVNCQTTLIEDWRVRYSEDLTFIGNREVRLSLDEPLPTEPLRHCIAMALTYHVRKKAKT